MFDIFITTHFSGAHHLREYPGDCERPHGHNWQVEVRVRAERVDPLGMGLDFKELKQRVKTIIDQLDHRDLNEHPAFQDRNPSSEHIALFLFQGLQEPLRHERYRLYSITVRETEHSGVTCYGP